MSNAYLTTFGSLYYCLLPNHIYKLIPQDWIESFDWGIVYYKVYQALLHKEITDDNIFYWTLEDIFTAINIKF